MKNFGTARERYTGPANVPSPQRAAVSNAQCGSDYRSQNRRSEWGFRAGDKYEQHDESEEGR